MSEPSSSVPEVDEIELLQERTPRLKRVRRALAYLAALPAAALVSRLPLPLARGLAKLVGSAAWLLVRRERRFALDNLRAAFGAEKSEEEIRRIGRGVFRHAAEAAADFLVIRRWPLEKLERRFHLAEDFRRIGETVTEGTSGITAHFGNWELLGVFFARYLPGLLVPMARRNVNAWIQRAIDRVRKELGLVVVYTEDSPRRLFEMLRANKLLGFLPDQDLRTPNGIFVDFFGRPAYTSTLPAHLARSAKASMLLCLLARQGEGYRLIFQHPINAPWSGDRRRDLEENTAIWTRLLEEEIRRSPEQWMWFHRRWRTQPGDEKDFGRPRWVKRRKRIAKLRSLKSIAAREAAADLDGGNSDGKD